ncbi:MAG: RNA polymerase sigma factor [Verrucomicrobiota bacterium]|nr:RNA polymerase sigma factor [Verrucomicrobiota bacterium]
MPDPFAEFVETYYRAAYNFAFSLSGNHADAADITQQAFYIAQKKSDQLRDPSKRKQWLFTILHREFLRTRRRAGRDQKHEQELKDAEQPPTYVDQATSIDGKAVVALLSSLDEIFRAPVGLFYFDQLSYREIAEVLDVPIGTVMSRLARGKRMLRQLIEGAPANQAANIVPMDGGQAHG